MLRKGGIYFTFTAKDSLFWKGKIPNLKYTLFSLDPDNLQLHCFLGLGTLFCCSFFCPLDKPCKTLQTVQVAPLDEGNTTQKRNYV